MSTGREPRRPSGPRCCDASGWRTTGAAASARRSPASSEALAIAEESDDRRGRGLGPAEPGLGGHHGRATSTAADATLARAARLFAELGDTTGRAWLRGTTAFNRLLAGRLHEARRLANAFLPFGERVGERWAVGTLRAVEAFAAAELGDLTSADREARRAYREFDEIDDDWGRGLALVVRGVVARGLGETGHAIDLLTEACRYGETHRTPAAASAWPAPSAASPRLDVGDPVARRVRRARRPRPWSSRTTWSRRPGSARGCCSAVPGWPLGDVDAALAALGEIAESDAAPAVLLSRRQAVAEYAAALLAAGRVDEAVEAARRAGRACPPRMSAAASSRPVVLARALAAAGELAEARTVAAEAVRAAYATQQTSERGAADAVLASVTALRVRRASGVPCSP